MLLYMNSVSRYFPMEAESVFHSSEYAMGLLVGRMVFITWPLRKWIRWRVCGGEWAPIQLVPLVRDLLLMSICPCSRLRECIEWMCMHHTSYLPEEFILVWSASTTVCACAENCHWKSAHALQGMDKDSFYCATVDITFYFAQATPTIHLFMIK